MGGAYTAVCLNSLVVGVGEMRYQTIPQSPIGYRSTYMYHGPELLGIPASLFLTIDSLVEMF
jgi:hypothetical protein